MSAKTPHMGRKKVLVGKDQEKAQSEKGNLVTNLNKISENTRIRKFKVIFLEIPMYSIRVYNEYLGHTNPNIVYDDDKTKAENENSK